MDLINVDKRIYFLYNILNGNKWEEKDYYKYKSLIQEVDMLIAEYEYITRQDHELDRYIVGFYEKLYALRR